MKVTEVYFTGSSDFDLVAGLTGISPERITNISPSVQTGQDQQGLANETFEENNETYLSHLKFAWTAAFHMIISSCFF